MSESLSKFIKLSNKNFAVTLCTLGASIYRIKYLGDDMILTPRKKEDYFLPYFYHGKTIGRLCGRILKDGEVILHGGEEGLSTREFSYIQKRNKVIFEYTSPDGESNCNGDFYLRVTYELSLTSLTISFYATVNKSCLVSLTNHAFFCLGEESTDKLSLKMGAERYLLLDDKMLPVKMADVPNNYNFEAFKPLTEAGNIDNFFVVRDGEIELKSSKYHLLIKSNFPGVVIYTDNFVDNVKTLLTDKIDHRGLAIEPQDHQLFRKELKLGETYERSIKYTFKKL